MDEPRRVLFPHFSDGIATRVSSDPVRTGAAGLFVFVASPILAFALVLGLVGGAVLAQVPYLGGLANLAIFLLGLGVLSAGLYVYSRRHDCPSREIGSEEAVTGGSEPGSGPPRAITH